MEPVPLSGEHGDLGQDAEILSPGSASGCLMMTIGHEIDGLLLIGSEAAVYHFQVETLNETIPADLAIRTA
jgi:hypothetical protein